MSFGREFWGLLRVSLGGAHRRIGLISTIVIGVACAVGVLVSMLAMGVGAREEAMGNARPDRVIVLSTGAQGPLQSSVAKDTASLIRELPGVRRNARGEPIAIFQVLVYLPARKRVGGTLVGFPLVGVSPGLLAYTPELHLTSGRMFQPGLRELIASNKCARQFVDFSVGDKRSMRGGRWPVVGNFDLGRTEGGCAVFGDADTLLSAFGRDAYNQVNVMLQSADGFAEFTAAINANPTLRVEAKRETDLTEESMKEFNGLLNFVSYCIGSIMAVAATFGATNSLYTIVDSRRREVATLRAIGFGAGPILVSVLSESILFALPGALIGSGLAWTFFNGLSASPFGFSFHLAVTAQIVALGVAWALGMGVVGGILPGLRAARVPVVTALRGM